MHSFGVNWHFQFIASIILFKIDSKIISFKWILVKIRNVNPFGR